MCVNLCAHKNVTCLVWMILLSFNISVCMCVCISAAVWYLLLKDLSDYFRLFKLNMIYCLLLHVLVGFNYVIVYFCSLVWNRHYRIYTLTLFFCLLLFCKRLVEKNHLDGKQILHSSKTNGKNFSVFYSLSFFHYW